MKIKEKPIQKTFKMSSSKKIQSKIRKKSKMKVIKSKKKPDISKMSTDEFMSGGFEDIGESDLDVSDTSRNTLENGDKIKKKKKLKNSKDTVRECSEKKLKSRNEDLVGKVKQKKLKKRDCTENLEREELDDDEHEDDVNVIKKHKEQLDGLKSIDPEFYNYLKEHDEDLLNFDESESDVEEEKLEEFHTPPATLEVASDESDFEPDEGGLAIKKSSDRVITMAMITSWHDRLPTTKNKKLLKDVIDAFHAAVLRVSTGDDQLFRFKVDGSPVFNAIIRMCVMHLHSGIKSFLKLEEGSRVPPAQSKSWVKIKSLLKIYFEDLTELTGVTSASMLIVLLKHIHQMIPYLIYFPNITQRTLRRLIDLWSKSEDVIRVLSFLCLLRLINRHHSFLSTVLKKMYLTYVRNTKFVSPNTLPEINFMRQSLSEMFVLDDTISYHMAFVYIRQLAVHLRNAITLKKKENYQTVYSWQFISSLQLWAELFGLVPHGSPLRSLVYPLIQIIIGTIKLLPSSQYYPLRFHCCKILINLSSKSGLFIPVLPFLLEVLQDFDFNREHKKLSMKPMDLTCLLRCSKLQMKENGFKDAIVDNINNLLIEYIATESYRISFPDICVPLVLQLKQFIKQCKVVNYTKLMKALLGKITENSDYIENERKKLNFNLNDTKSVEAIEAGIKVKGTPFLKYYENWKKVYMQQQAKKVVNNLKVGDFKLPVIYKLDKRRSRAQSRSVGPPELFPSDDEECNESIKFGEESDEDNGNKKKRKLRENCRDKSPSMKKIKREPIEDECEDDNGKDIIQDFVLSDAE